jgi:hypothetical protein
MLGVAIIRQVVVPPISASIVMGEVAAAATRPAVLRRNVVVEVVLVVSAQVPHAKQDDDHNEGDHGCQTDQHGLRHRTIRRGV